MKNRITVTIADQEYVLLADQDAAAATKIAEHVDAKLRQVMDGSRLSVADGAILTAMNIAEEYFKEQEAAENLRRQLKEYLEETAAVKQELSEAKREIFRLQQQKK
ncbi:MAG: cell division protein ZapA [Oscillospiraceae bacterium]|nr:cell division protein ZapA [Oscillospiraceae bacterium]